MNRSTRAERRKLQRTRSLWALPVVGFAVSAVAATVLMGWLPAEELPTSLHEHGSLRFGASNLGLAVVLFGIRMMGDESHHGTLAATYLAQPDRRQVLAAKAVVAVATTAVLCVAVDAVVLVSTGVSVAARDLPMAVDVAATAGVLLRSIAAMSLLVLLGLALGAAVRNRTAALVGWVVALAFGEPIVGGLLRAPEVLPSAAVRGLVTAGDGIDVLGPVPAAGLLVAYVLVGVVAALLALDRDVA